MRNPFELFAFGSFHGEAQRHAVQSCDAMLVASVSRSTKLPMLIIIINLVLGAKWLERTLHAFLN